MWMEKNDYDNNIDFNKITNTFSKTSFIFAETLEIQIIPNNHFNNSQHLHNDEIYILLSNDCYEKTRSQTEESSLDE